MTIPKLANGLTVLSSVWRVLPDSYNPPDMAALQSRADACGCVLIEAVTPDGGGYLHTVSMVPKARSDE